MKLVNIISEIFAKLKDGEGNVITSTDLGSGKRGIDVSTTISLGTISIDSVDIVDQDGHHIDIDHIGRLHITDAIPNTLLNHTALTKTISEAIGGHDYRLDTYVIPNGKLLCILKLSATCMTGDSSVGLYLCPSGTFVEATAVSLGGIFLNSGIQQVDLDVEITGDGTKAIVMRVSRRDKGKRWIVGVWEGMVEN